MCVYYRKVQSVQQQLQSETIYLMYTKIKDILKVFVVSHQQLQRESDMYTSCVHACSSYVHSLQLHLCIHTLKCIPHAVIGCVQIMCVHMYTL